MSIDRDRYSQDGHRYDDNDRQDDEAERLADLKAQAGAIAIWRGIVVMAALGTSAGILWGIAKLIGLIK